MMTTKPMGSPESGWQAVFRVVSVDASACGQIESVLNQISSQGYEIISMIPVSSTYGNGGSTGINGATNFVLSTALQLQIIARKYELKEDKS